MAIVISGGERKEVILAPADTYSGTCYNIWDLGWQKVTYMGKEKIVEQIIIGFEIDCLIPHGDYQGKRFTITKKYTKSLYEKANLRKDLESWRGKPFSAEEIKRFDVEALIGAPCMISVIHKPSKDGSKTYANIGTITKLPKGLTSIVPENERTTPEWITKLIASQVENPHHQEPESQNGQEEPNDEAIPF